MTSTTAVAPVVAGWPVGHFRRLGAKDARHLGAHLRRLHPDDLQQRFMGTRHRLFVHRYVRGIDWHRTVIIGCFVGRSLRGVCELHPIAQPRAEIAISVERRFQRRGIGRELFRRTLLLARNRGLTALELRCTVDNHRVRQLIKSFDGKIVTEPMEASATIRSLPANAFTFATEMVEQAGLVGSSLIRFWLAGSGWPERGRQLRDKSTADLLTTTAAARQA